MTIEGAVAWDVLSSKTRRMLKEEILSIYERGEEVTAEEISHELGDKVPVDVIAIAIAELIDEGKVVEEDINPADILSIVRQNRVALSRIEKKIDVIAEGIARIIKVLNDVKQTVDEDYNLDMEVQSYITSVSDIAPKKEEKLDDSGNKGTVETENSGDGKN